MNLDFTDPVFFIDSLFAINRNFDTILIGTADLKELEKKMFSPPHPELKDRYRKFSNLEDLATETAEHSLTHEALHIALYKVGGWDACDALDIIDKDHEISEFAICDDKRISVM